MDATSQVLRKAPVPMETHADYEEANREGKQIFRRDIYTYSFQNMT